MRDDDRQQQAREFLQSALKAIHDNILPGYTVWDYARAEGVRLMTTQEALDALGCSRMTLWRRVRDGRLNPIPFPLDGEGGWPRYLWHPDEVQRVLEQDSR